MPSNSETTPPTSLRILEDNFNADEQQQSPEPNIAKPIQPPSILKSDKKQSRLPATTGQNNNFNLKLIYKILGEKPKIRFAQSLFTTEQIPSRAERFLKHQFPI